MYAKIQKDTEKIIIVRKYEVDGKKYIVSATTKFGAIESAASKIRRLIKNEIKNSHEKN